MNAMCALQQIQALECEHVRGQHVRAPPNGVRTILRDGSVVLPCDEPVLESRRQSIPFPISSLMVSSAFIPDLAIF